MSCMSLVRALKVFTSLLISFNSIRKSKSSDVVSRIVFKVRTIVEANFKFVVSSKMISARIR